MAKFAPEALTSKSAGFLDDDDGAAAIEYGLIAALIAAMLVITLTALGSTLNDRFSQLASGMAATSPESSSSSSDSSTGGKGHGKGGNGNGNNGNGNGNGGPNGG